MVCDSKYIEYMMMKKIIKVTWTKKIKAFLYGGLKRPKANNHELGQKALSFWERKKSTQLRAELKLDQCDL